MKNFNKIVSITAGMLLVLGLLLMAVGGMNGGFRQLSKMDFNGPFMHFSYDFSGDKNDKTDVKGFTIKDGEETTFDAASVKEIGVNVGGCQMRVEKSEDGRIHVKSSGKLKVKAALDGDTLNIKSDNSQSINENNKLIIAIPEGLSFDKIDLNLGAIAMMSEVALDCEKLNLHTGAGSINIKEITAKNMDIDAGAGDISFGQAYTEDMDLDIGMGNIKYSGDITGDLDLDISMGNADIELDSSEKDHNYDVRCSGGAVRLGDNKSVGISSDKDIDNNANSNFDIDCAMGNVNIIFGDKL